MINTRFPKQYCRDDISKIENYREAVNSEVMYDCHHRLELTIENEFAHTKDELIRFGMYYNRPYFELIFLPSQEHISLHSRSMPEGFRKKQGEKVTGEGNGMFGKKHSQESREKMSMKHLGKAPGNKGKKLVIIDGKKRYV